MPTPITHDAIATHDFTDDRSDSSWVHAASEDVPSPITTISSRYNDHQVIGFGDQQTTACISSNFLSLTNVGRVAKALVDVLSCSVFSRDRLMFPHCFTPLTPARTLLKMRQDLLEALDILLACQHLIHLALAASERLEHSHLAPLSNKQPFSDEPAGPDDQPTDPTTSRVNSLPTSLPAPTYDDTAYATDLDQFLVPIRDYEAADPNEDASSQTNTQSELPPDGSDQECVAAESQTDAPGPDWKYQERN
ncbi:hypothetical protein PCANC_25305 [Puccinia coronata f. sp. avenae]|uniref:Uncharacterized protein n=1 Tax=Puccinia coronata f. sp. avenae TaxID=200324 RepID=A0A2N5THJ1_9BASI|nr:hypothetical protein PCANC_25305 [Puccinia coronata f. sp. avenae]